MASALIQTLLWPNPLHAPSGTGLMFHFDNPANPGQEATGYPSGNIYVPAAPYVQIDTISAKFGAGSLAVYSTKGMADSGGPITTGYIRVDASGSLLQLSTVANPQNWCVECWIKPQRIDWATVWGYGYYGQYNPDLYIFLQLYLGKLSLFLGQGSTTPVISFNHPTTIAADGTWHHVALVQNGTTFTIFLDGVGYSEVHNSPPWTAGPFNTSYGLTIGCGSLSSVGGTTWGPAAMWYPYFGDIDDFRLTAGNSVYTSNFTPTGPLLP